MFNKITKLFFASAVCAMFFTSCEKLKDFGDTNVNPNGVTDPNTAFLLTNVLAGQGRVDFNAGYYCQYFTDPFYPQNAQYSFTTAGVGDYSGQLMDLENIIRYNTDPALKNGGNVISNGAPENQIAISRIMKAYIYWRNTDALGDVPFSEALKGQEGVFTPKYDKQEDVYKGIIKELSEAVEQFDNVTGVPAFKGDIIFDGNRTKWKKFANSLRLLMALRLSKRFPLQNDYAANEAKKAVEHSAGVITDNADNFTVRYPGGVFANPLSSENQSGLSKTFTDLMLGMTDARLNAFGARSFNPPNNNVTSTIGIPYGLNTTDGTSFTNSNPNWARVLLASYRQANSPMVIIGAAHVLLARAECLERNWFTISGTSAAQDYSAGISASFQQWNLAQLPLTNADFESGAGVATIGVNSFNTIPATSSASTTTQLQRIQLQQFIAWFPDGFQAWNNWKRTAIPNLQASTFNLNSDKGIPRRYAYSQQQYNTNNANVLEAVSRLNGGDAQDSKMWWDQ
jgi:hypothetical protein